MVYCGKPSGGCYACRERKSRCDKLPEGCTQCRKAKRECPGYRQLGDVIFHNESEKVARKARASEARNKAKKDAEDLAIVITPHQFTHDTALNARNVGQEVLSQSLELVDPRYRNGLTDFAIFPPVEELAEGIFVTNYAARIQGESGPGRFDYLAGNYRDYALDEGLLSSMRAVGFASYAHSTQSSALLNKACLQYAQAIKLTNIALTSPEYAKKDTTVLSILVLGVFETLTGTQPTSLKHWSQHINGAAAVIRLRGREQIQTIAGRRILFQVSSNLLITCIARSKPLPEFLSQWTEEAIALSESPPSAIYVHRTMIQVAKLRADVASGAELDLDVILNKALELDSLMSAVYSNPPEGWAYETVYTDIKSSHVWNGKYHVYADCWIVQLWNALRMIRAILNELVCKVIHEGRSSSPRLFQQAIYTTQLENSTRVLDEMQSDILSSVPQHLFALPTPAVIQKEAMARERAKTQFEEATTTESTPGSEKSDFQTHLELTLRMNQPLMSTTTTDSIFPSELFADADQAPLSEHSPSRNNNSSSHPNQSTHIQPLPNLLQPSFFLQQRKTNSAARAYGGNFLMWPLWFAGVMDNTTPEVKVFAARNLRDVGKELGIRQGFVLADLLESGGGLDV